MPISAYHTGLQVQAPSTKKLITLIKMDSGMVES